MKKTFTILIAAIAAIMLIIQPVTAWADNVTVISENFNNGTASGWTLSGNTSFPGTSGAKSLQIASGNGAGSAKTPAFSSLVGSTATLTFKAKSSGTATRTLTITGTNCKVNGNASTTISATSTQQEFTISITNAGISSTVTFSAAKSAGTIIDDVLIYYVSGPTQLSAPTNFSATAGNAQATFSWTAVDHASNYTILAKNGETWENPTTLFDGVSLTNGQYVGTGLTNGTTYVCKVRANGDGTNYSNSALSDATATFTPTAAQQYTVSIADGINGGTAGANPTTATAGTEISLTKTPTAGYGFTSWNVYKTGDPNTTVTVTNDKFNMPAYDVTVSATFTPYTVTLSANGSTSTWNVTMNNGNIPDASAPCAAWSFYKWSTSAVASQTTTAPTSTVNATGYKPTGDITLYAVYKKTEGGSAFSNTSNGGDFNIYALVSGNNGTTAYYAKGTGSKIDSDTDSSNATTYTFEKPTGQNYGDYEYAIKTGSTYITYSSSTDLGTSTTTPYKWTITEGTKGTWRVTSGTDGRAFIFRAGSTNKFGGYATSNVTTSGTEYYDLEIGSPSTTYYHSTPDCTETVATPIFDPDGGNFETTQTVHISCETSDVSIFYTLNGDEPTDEASETNFAYNAQEGVSIASTITLKAKAYKTDWYPSAVASATYTIQHDVAEPTLPESQVFTTPTYSVKITVPANTTVYYTTNGDNPTNASTLYSTAFTIDATKTVKAIAYDGDGCASDVVSATYTRAYTLADAKALYDDEDVENITINLAGVQIAAQSGKYAYAQQGNVGLLIYGTTSQTFTAGDNITSGTVTGTITKYNENMELSIATDTYSSIVKTAGALTASATGVTIPNITSSFSTYESRYIALTSLTMSVSGKTLTDTDSHTLAIYDPFNVLNEAIQPDHNVIVNGVITSNTKNSTTTYQIIPLAKSGISTGVAATLPTLDPLGGETVGEAVETETVTITPATGTTVTYAFGEDYDEIDSVTELTVPSTNATALELVVNRDFYTENTATYYYKTSATTYDVTFYVNGDEDPSLAKEVIEGGTLGVLPTPTAPSGYTFRGWAQDEISGVQNNAPTMVTSTTTVNAAMDLYAVFAIETESTTNENLTYSLDKDDFATGSYTSNDGEKTIKGVKLQIKDVYQNSSSIQIKASTGAFYNKEALGIKVTSVVIDVKTNTIKVFEGSKTDQFTEVTSSGSGSEKTYTFSTQNDNPYFKITATSSYAQANTITVNYVALVNVLSYSNYCTTVSMPSPEALPIDANGNLTGNATIPTGAAYTLTTPVKVGSGKTFTVSNNAVFANADPANLIIEDGGQLICSNSVAATVKKSIANANAKDPKNHWYTISAPVHTGSNNYVTIGASTTVNLTNNGAYDMFAYDEPTHYWLNQKSGSGATGFDKMYAGQGYMYRNSGNELSYVGNTTVGPVDIALSYTSTLDVAGLKGFNLIGNPYTHSIAKGSGKAIDNSKLSTGCYALTNSGTWTLITDGAEIKPNQGVLVEVSEAVADFQIKDINYVAPTPDPGKYKNDNIKFIVESSEYSDAAYAWFDKGIGLTKINHRNENAPMLYIPQDDNNYAIATMSDDVKVFGLNFKAATMGQYTLSYKATGDYNYLHIIDRLTGADVDMLLEGEYTFVATPNDKENRFIVRLDYMPNYSEGNNEIFAYQSGNEILVSGQGELQIFDVTGRRVMTTTINGAESINLSAQGVYILRLVGNEVKTQKIVVR